MNARNVVVVVLVMLFLLPIEVSANETQRIKKLDTISDEALQMVKTYRYDDANKLLKFFQEEFLTVTSNGHIFSMDELRVITVAYNDAADALGATEIEHQERVNKVTKFRLVLDAVLSTYQPLWTELEAPIMTVFSEMKTAVENGDNEDFYENLDSFLSLYNVIYPSLKIDITPTKIQQINARVNYIDQFRPEILTETASLEELMVLEEELKSLFSNRMKEDETDPSLWWVIICTGSIIIATLSYVGWRKFKAERERRLNRLKERKN
ncbi:sporulation protein YpjB [Bacillus sp. B15-48]|uniref:sporulation protein YpjB n=1 Tax=Bacillus sp. B15-48 TaxID=1548601 RepID=UPI00193FB7BD|nr:sporulation protein YpjB [Bacillus sp. B15-48]MBM4762109.1 sporulation protein YpjB [Bacillus sp. B15-48]